MKKNMKGGASGQGEEEGVQYLPVGEVLTSGILNGLGIKLDSKSIEDYNKLLHNPVALKKMESGLQNLTNVVVAPVFTNALNQMVEPLSEGIHKIEENVLNEAVSAIPVVGQGIEMGKYALGTGAAVLETANQVTNIAKDSVEQIQEAAEKLNPINKINNQINNQIESLENSIAIPINNKQIIGKAGGARILSRIQKSVKNFIGKSKKITHKNTNKKGSMKGGSYNKNKKRVLSQKGGQILSRINESLKTFNRM